MTGLHAPLPLQYAVGVALPEPESQLGLPHTVVAGSGLHVPSDAGSEQLLQLPSHAVWQQILLTQWALAHSLSLEQSAPSDFGPQPLLHEFGGAHSAFDVHVPQHDVPGPEPLHT